MATRTHDEVIRQVRALARRADRKAIAGAFVASLGVAPGPWRAVLGALATALAVPTHKYRPFSAASRYCAECGLLPSVEVEEPSERGNDVPGDLPSALAVLEQAKRATPPVATAADARRLTKLLATVGTLPATARENALSDALRKAKLVAGNRYDVRAVIETLGACGVLQTPEYPGFTTRWTTFAARQARPSSRVECDPPIAFWTAAHGVDAGNVKTWFGAFGVTAPAAAKPRKVAVAKVSKTMTAREKRAARATELELGDIIAFPLGSAWHAAQVVGHHRDVAGRVPILSALEWRGRAMPALAELGTVPRRPAAWMMDVWVRDDRRGRWKTIGTLTPESTVTSRYGVGRLGRDASGLALLLR